MGVELAIRVAAVVGISILAAVLRRIPFFQVKSERFTSADLSELTRKYAKWEALAVFPLLTFAAAFGYLAYLLLLGIADWYYSLGEPPVHRRVLTEIAWMLPALFIGILCAAPVLAILFRLILREEYHEYMEFCDLRHGVNGWRLVTGLVWMLLLMGAVGIPQMLWTHASFYPNEIRFRNFTSFSERHFSYSDVKQLAQVERFQAPNGNWIQRPHHIVEFSDGTVWKTISITDPDPVKDTKLFEFLTEKTKLPLGQIREWPKP